MKKKKIMLIFYLSMIASAQVLVKQSVNDNSATGVKIVTVLLTVKGDKTYSSDPSAPPAELGIMCQQMSVGKRQKAKVALTLGTGVKAENRLSGPGLWPSAVSRNHPYLDSL